MKINAEIIFLIQARLGSSRLPGKVLKKVYKNYTLLDILILRLLRSKYISRNNLYILTSTNKIDNKIEEYARINDIKFFRGDEFNVYKRFYDFLCSLNSKPKYFFRICADNPLIEIKYMEEYILISEREDADYYSHKSKNGKPAIKEKYGIFSEMINTNTFLSLLNNIEKSEIYYKEHVTPYFYENNYKIRLLPFPIEIKNYNFSFTVDTLNDFEQIKIIINKINGNFLLDVKEILRIINNR
jgi:spore coat polysaccharide biosynthesis protein SpsF